MPKRRLSARQIERIRTIQDRRRQRLEQRAEGVLDELDVEHAEERQARSGRVVVRHGANLAVEDGAGTVYHCLSRRHIGHPVCGDEVVWQPTGEGNGIVTALQPRRTVLSRPDYSGRDKPLAANVSLLVVVIAPRPEPSGYLIDQYLVTAELMGVKALIVCNKMDLLDADAGEAFLAGLAHYQRIGYPLLGVSVRGEPTLTPLIRPLGGQTAILLGQSGVGKSSLVKALLPDQAVQIGRLSEATGLGRHTTSAATCYRLPQGGSLIDSPGVRSFRLGAIARSELERGFRELAPYRQRCRFADCRHVHEPDCAIQAAVAAGAIDPRRLANFHHLAARLEAGLG